MRGSFWGLRCRGWGWRFLVRGGEGEGRGGLDVDGGNAYDDTCSIYIFIGLLTGWLID